MFYESGSLREKRNEARRAGIQRKLEDKTKDIPAAKRESNK
jgi:hypothetical protein